MEAVPKLPLISFELKVSAEKTHFAPKLQQYIADVYKEDPDKYSNEFHELECLRSAAVRPNIDSDGLSTLTRYFCQLRLMQSRFPMSIDQPAACNFSWKDLYANVNCKMADIRYEMAGILYNIGALHTQLGASEPRTSPESLKAACTHYQNAAWAFMHLREHYAQPTGVDVSADNMRLLQEICFAQAQECILDKSIQDTRKPSVVGAVATQVMLFYKNSLSLLGPSTGSDNIHDIIGTKLYNYWHRYLSFKSSFIGCIVSLYQGLNAEEQQKMGERLAFYQQAADKLAEARKLSKYIEPVQITLEALTFTNDVVEGKRKAAKNENEFIYHEEVPAKELLVELKPVCLVKALPINFNDPEVSGPDIFSRLVPMGAHEASSVYSEEKAMILRHVVNQAEAKNTQLTEFMSSLQLDQLDVLDSQERIPEEIVDRCAAMNAKTEIIQSLVDSMNTLAEIITDVEHSLAEIKTMIQDEIQKEKDFQKIMGPRPPSIVQTELSREFQKYQEAHNRTNESNQVLHKAMTLHIANLRLLAQPLDVLTSKIPSIQNIEGLDRTTMMEMRRVVGKAREMQAQRDSLIQQLRDDINNDDITSQLLARNTEPPEEIFKQELDKHTHKLKIIEQNLSAQENIIKKLTSLYASYAESRRMLSEVLRKREGLINALITSFDTYEELLGKSQKGLEFYKKLTLNVNQLLSRLRSTCQVQEEERAQQLARQTGKASSATPPPSAVKVSNLAPTPSGAVGKLKDYLPYMKNRGLARNVPPQAAQMDSLPSEQYYPESIYPTSVRPAPLGSEATDQTQMALTDGMSNMSITQNPYNRYNPQLGSHDIAYSQNFGYPATNKGSEKDQGYGYSSPYTPSQFPNQIAEPQYSNPYYSGGQNNPGIMTDSQNTFTSQLSLPTSQFQGYNMPGQMGVIPEMSNTSLNQELNPLGHMPVNKEHNFSDYSQIYNANYPHTATPNMATYSHAPQNSNTNMVPSQIPSDYGSLNYPYSSPNPGLTNQPGISQMSMTQPSLTQQPSMTPQPDMTSQPGITQPGISSQPGMTPQPGVAMHPGMTPQTGMTMTPQPGMSSQPVMTPPMSMTPQPGPSTQPGMSQPGMQPGIPQQMITQPGMPPQPMNQLEMATSTNNGYIMNHGAMTQVSNPYMSDQNVSHPYSIPDSVNYGYSSQGYTIYTNTESAMTSTTTMVNPPQVADNLGPPYNAFPSDNNINQAALAQLDVLDQPIKSHVTGEALSAATSFQPGYPYDQSNYSNITNPSEQSVTFTNQTQQTFQPPTNQPNYKVNYALIDQTGAAYTQNIQNPLSYTFNTSTGNYEYSYGLQNSGYGEANIDLQAQNQGSNWSPQGVQSPGEIPQNLNTEGQLTSQAQAINQEYYNTPYGYQTITNQPTEVVPNSVQSPTNYGANVNQSTYMQPGLQNNNVKFSNTSDQASSPVENVTEPNFDQNASHNHNIETHQVDSTVKSEILKPENKVLTSEPNEPDLSNELTTIDLLSGIDFSVEQKPLMPEIKVPPVSESIIKKVPILPKTEPLKVVVKEEIIERPAKRDLFSDAGLLNNFTAEVKSLQRLTDSFTDRTAAGLTVLDAKWKGLQDVQSKENMTRSRKVATKHTEGNITDIAPYDDSRLTLKSDPGAYINASYYKQLASWCIPLVISKTPNQHEHSTFWRAVMENKISSVVCLLSEIEMQGKVYWPTAKGQTLALKDVKVTLEEVTCTVHWTERKLSVTDGQTAGHVTHYQINVFPAKIVCSPLVLLSDKILSQTYAKRLSNQLSAALIQCEGGAGRSSVVALLIMLMCQVRSGQINLCEMLDDGCINLYKNRTNVLEDTKYLADAYRTALFYVQGVLCSGTPMFNGEAVSIQSPTPSQAVQPAPSIGQKHKFSRESFEEMKQAPGLKSGDMKDPLNFLDPLWSLKKK